VPGAYAYAQLHMHMHMCIRMRTHMHMHVYMCICTSLCQVHAHVAMNVWGNVSEALELTTDRGRLRYTEYLVGWHDSWHRALSDPLVRSWLFDNDRHHSTRGRSTKARFTKKLPSAGATASGHLVVPTLPEGKRARARAYTGWLLHARTLPR